MLKKFLVFSSVDLGGQNIGFTISALRDFLSLLRLLRGVVRQTRQHRCLLRLLNHCTEGCNYMKLMRSFRRQKPHELESEWASERRIERSGTRERSKQWGASGRVTGPLTRLLTYSLAPHIRLLCTVRFAHLLCYGRLFARSFIRSHACETVEYLCPIFKVFGIRVSGWYSFRETFLDVLIKNHFTVVIVVVVLNFVFV